MAKQNNNKTAQELEKLKQAELELSGAIKECTNFLKQAGSEWAQYSDKAMVAKTVTDETGTLFAMAGKKILSYASSFDRISKIWNAFKKGTAIIKEIDDSMTELKRTGTETALAYEKFQTQAAVAGRSVARSTSEMILASRDWKKMGYDLQEALALANASSLYVNVTDNMDITQSTSNLASIMRAFNLTAEDADGIVDRLSAVSNHYAVTSMELGDIISRTSSSLAGANTSLDQAIAMGAAINEVLQDSTIASDTLEVLSMRLRGAKADLEAAGKSTDGMADSISKMRSRIRELTDIDSTGGFDVMKDDTTFKNLYEQMDGIAGKWKDMGDSARGGLLEMIAGKSGAQGVSALLNNWAEAEAILQTSLSASGYAEQENERYLDSISGKIKLLQDQYQELWQETIDDDTVKFFIDLAASITRTVTDMGGLVPVAASLGAALASIKYAGKQIRNRDNECALLINAA